MSGPFPLSLSLSLPVCLSILVYLPTNLEGTLALDGLYEKERKEKIVGGLVGHGSPGKELTLDLFFFFFLKGCLALSLSPSVSLPVCLSILVYLPTNLEETLALDGLYEKERKEKIVGGLVGHGSPGKELTLDLIFF